MHTGMVLAAATCGLIFCYYLSGIVSGLVAVLSESSSPASEFIMEDRYISVLSLNNFIKDTLWVCGLTFYAFRMIMPTKRRKLEQGEEGRDPELEQLSMSEPYSLSHSFDMR